MSLRPKSRKEQRWRERTVILKRWIAADGAQPTLANTGLTFDEVADERVEEIAEPEGDAEADGE
jgi:hypothetical protein